MEHLSIDKQYKCKVIKDINKMLLRHHQNPLDTADFDTLYDLDIDELLDAQVQIHQQIMGSLPRIEHY